MLLPSPPITVLAPQRETLLLWVCVCVESEKIFVHVSVREHRETCCSPCRESKLYLGRNQNINMEDLLCLGLILVFLSDVRAIIFVIFGAFACNKCSHVMMLCASLAFMLCYGCIPVLYVSIAHIRKIIISWVSTSREKLLMASTEFI